MSPDSSVAENITYNCISEKGKQYAIYFPFERSGELALNIPPGDYEATWFHPLTGKYESASINNKMTLQFPRYKEDIALKLIRKP